MFSTFGVGCPRCGHLQSDGNTLCSRCNQSRPAFQKAYSLYAYAGAVRLALHRYKFRGDLDAGRTLQLLLNDDLERLQFDASDYEFAVCVPLHPRRQRQRGFNQAWELLAHLSTFTRSQKSPDTLERFKETAAQHQLNLSERHGNLARAFRLKKGREALVRNRSILLVDDLLTTGATAHQCSEVLREAGAKKVDVLTLCRAIL